MAHVKVNVDLPAEKAGLLFVPSPDRSTGPQMSPYDGDEVEVSLAPGDYAVYAFSDWQSIEFRNPKFLQTLSGGVTVHIEEGKQQEIAITKVSK